MRYQWILSSIVLLLLTFTAIPSSAVPLDYEFTDPEGDAEFAKFLNPGYTVTNNTGINFVDIVGVGYEIERNTGQVTFEIRVAGNVELNSSFYFAMAMQLENDTHQVTIRTYFGSIGSIGSGSNSSSLDLIYIRGSSQNDRRQISASTSTDSIYWQFTTDLLDLVSIFDNPEMPLTEVQAELEFSVNGSSSFGGGDYYRDEFFKTEFEFVGAAQSENTAETFLEIFDPIAIFLYFGIPLIYIIIRLTKRFMSN